MWDLFCEKRRKKKEEKLEKKFGSFQSNFKNNYYSKNKSMAEERMGENKKTEFIWERMANKIYTPYTRLVESQKRLKSLRSVLRKKAQ